MSKTVKSFIKHHFRHFNAATLVAASEAYCKHLEQGGKMMVTLAGAMSTAELGLSLAEMIRKGKVHAICSTGANLEEDVFNLIAHEHYRRIPDYRQLASNQETDLYNKGLCRVTDTCIPEGEAMRPLGKALTDLWRKADKEGKSYFPYEYYFQLIETGALKKHYQVDPKDSWVVAACEKKLPVFTPGWEDSTTGNLCAAEVMKKNLSGAQVVKSGLDQMVAIIHWYREHRSKQPIGFFQIGGGIAGDFPICVVPLIRHDLNEEVGMWEYFCQISDSTTSYGSYSGAVPNEKITWGKLDESTPRFVIESDATVVAPLMFAYILDM